MKIKIDGRSFIYPDSDIEWFDSLGNVKYKLIDRIVRSRPNKGDKFDPESWNNFNKTELKDKTVWISKSRNSNDKNFEIEKKAEVKKDMVKIRVGEKWHEYPGDQIKSWDSEGNIEWSDKIHWKFLRGRPSKGDEFVYDESKFIKQDNILINKESIDISLLKELSYNFEDKYFELYKNKKICLIGSGDFKNNINYEKYDIIVGINQIYKTDFFEKVDIIYHGISDKDPFFYENLNFYSNFKKIILIPRISKNNKNRVKKIIINNFNNNKIMFDVNIIKNLEDSISTNPLSGVTSLTHISRYSPNSIDIYGFNFYENDYIEGMIVYNDAKKSHNIDSNKKHFDNILIENKKINWIK